MKKVILLVVLMLASTVSIADPNRSYSNSVGGIEGIEFIRDHLPGTFKYLQNEWRQTNINQIVAVRADKQSKANAKAIEQLEDEVDSAINDLNAGIAGAMAAASLPVANKGSDSFMIGAGIYNGEAAIAIGLSGNTVDGKILKFSFTSDTAGNSGASAGASFEF